MSNTLKKRTRKSSDSSRDDGSDIVATSAPATASTAQAVNSASHAEISIRAYAIYVARGQQPGCELDDWLEAERDLARDLH